MKLRLMEIMACPKCKRTFNLTVFEKKGAEISEGLLKCNCGNTYPIVSSIPRILPDAFHRYAEFTRKYLNRLGNKFFKLYDTVSDRRQTRTTESFGFQWRSFYTMYDAFEMGFKNYIYPIDEASFNGKQVLDAGCGFGRHVYYAAKYGAEVIGIDISQAVDSAFENTHAMDNVHLIQADIYNLPFRQATFDFIYSLGVLHHLPRPRQGFYNLVQHLKPYGSISIWVYSNKRKIVLRLLEAFRYFTIKLPYIHLKRLCYMIAAFEYVYIILPYNFLLKSLKFRRLLKQKFLARVALYSKYPFEVIVADWFDRLSPPIRFYYNADDLKHWFKNMKMSNVRISETGLYGWRGFGERQE